MRRIKILLSLLILTTTSLAQTDKQWTPQERVMALSRFWAEADKNFVYMEKVGRERWDSLYQTTLPEVMRKDMTDLEFLFTMERMCAFLGDGHTNVWTTGKATLPPLTLHEFGDVALWWETVENRAIITSAVGHEAKSIPLGSEIIDVDGCPLSEHIAKNCLPYISESAPHARQAAAMQRVLMGTEGTRHKVTFKKGAKQITMELENKFFTGDMSEVKKLPGAAKLFERPSYEMRWEKGDVAYLRVGTFTDDAIIDSVSARLPEIKSKARGVIIDLRNNGGGDGGKALRLICMFTNRSSLLSSAWRTRHYVPAYAAWGVYTTPADTIGNGYNRRNYIMDKGYDYLTFPASEELLDPQRMVAELPVVLLINSGTCSAAEDFMIMVDGLDNFMSVGSPTHGSTGQPIMIDLIPGLICRICTKADTYPDGREFVGYGVKPDIEVPLTVESLYKGEDKQLDVAKQLLNYKK